MHRNVVHSTPKCREGVANTEIASTQRHCVAARACGRWGDSPVTSLGQDHLGPRRATVGGLKQIG